MRRNRMTRGGAAALALALTTAGFANAGSIYSNDFSNASQNSDFTTSGSANITFDNVAGTATIGGTSGTGFAVVDTGFSSATFSAFTFTVDLNSSMTNSNGRTGIAFLADSSDVADPSSDYYAFHMRSSSTRSLTFEKIIDGVASNLTSTVTGSIGSIDTGSPMTFVVNGVYASGELTLTASLTGVNKDSGGAVSSTFVAVDSDPLSGAFFGFRRANSNNNSFVADFMEVTAVPSDVTVVPTPEPVSLTALCLGSLMLMRRRSHASC